MRTAERSVWLRAVVLGVLVGIAAVLALTTGLPSVGVVRSWLDDAGGVGWAAMVLGVAVLLLGPVPRAGVSLLVGVVGGFWPGLAVALAGGLLGGLAAFALSRALGRPAAARLAGPRLAVVDRLMADSGFLAVLTGRLLPMVPFVLLSYGAGLTAVRPATYTVATAIGLVPGTVVQVGAGAAAGTVVAWSTALVAVPLALAVLVAGGLVLLARRRRPAPGEPAPT